MPFYRFFLRKGEITDDTTNLVHHCQKQRPLP